MQLISFARQGKDGKRRKGNLCVHWSVCVDVSGEGEVSVPLLYVKHIFKTCSKPDGSASTNQRLSH